MKITRLTTYFDADQVITVLELLDELREAICNSYQQDIEQWQKEQYLQQQRDGVNQTQQDGPFNDPLDF